MFWSPLVKEEGLDGILTKSTSRDNVISYSNYSFPVCITTVIGLQISDTSGKWPKWKVNVRKRLISFFFFSINIRGQMVPKGFSFNVFLTLGCLILLLKNLLFMFWQFYYYSISVLWFTDIFHFLLFIPYAGNFCYDSERFNTYTLFLLFCIP